MRIPFFLTIEIILPSVNGMCKTTSFFLFSNNCSILNNKSFNPSPFLAEITTEFGYLCFRRFAFFYLYQIY